MEDRAYFYDKIEIKILYSSLEHHDIFGALHPISIVAYFSNWIGAELGLVLGKDFIWDSVGTDGVTFLFDDREDIADRVILFKLAWG